MKSVDSRSATFMTVRGSFPVKATLNASPRTTVTWMALRICLDDVLHDPHAALLLVQVEVLDDALEARAAEDLLLDRRQPVVELGRDLRADEALGHPRRNHQNQRLGLVKVRQTRT